MLGFLADSWFNRAFGAPAVAGFAAVLAAVFAGLGFLWLVGSSVVRRLVQQRESRRDLVDKLHADYFSETMGIETTVESVLLMRKLAEPPEGPSPEWMNERLRREGAKWRV